MSNSPIYEEFKKKVGKTSVRSVIYARTQCKNCNSIIEISKYDHKRGKGYCGKCRSTETALKLTGQKFGHLTVVKRVENSKHGKSRWLCQCSCGNKKVIIGEQLNYKKSKSCGCGHGLSLKQYIKNKIKVIEDGKWLWQGSLFRDGYGQARWNGKTWTAHSLSYTAFKGEIPPNYVVCHKNDCRQDVNPENLFLGTHKENSEDMVKKERSAKGSKVGTSKLKESQVKKIKKMIAEGVICNDIAKLYNVNFSTIARIRDRKTWRHVPWPESLDE